MSDPLPTNCEEALRLLATYLDGELRAAEHDLVERHLEICRSCFSRAEFERRLKAELSGLAREAVTPSFDQRIRRLLGSFAIAPVEKPAD